MTPIAPRPPSAPPPAPKITSAARSAHGSSVAPVALQSAKVPSVPPASVAPRSAPRPYARIGSGTFAAGEPEIIAADSGHCIGCYEGVLICIWRDAPTVSALETVRAAFAAMAEERSRGAGVLGVAEEGMPTIGAIERRITSELFIDLGRRALFVACAVEGDGLWASTARSVMTAIGIVAHRPCPLKIFRHAMEAAEWQGRFPTGAAPVALNEAVERCRAQMGRR